jgi:hypothetical protein
MSPNLSNEVCSIFVSNTTTIQVLEIGAGYSNRSTNERSYENEGVDGWNESKPRPTP